MFSLLSPPRAASPTRTPPAPCYPLCHVVSLIPLNSVKAQAADEKAAQTGNARATLRRNAGGGESPARSAAPHPGHHSPFAGLPAPLCCCSSRHAQALHATYVAQRLLSPT